MTGRWPTAARTPSPFVPSSRFAAYRGPRAFLAAVAVSAIALGAFMVPSLARAESADGAQLVVSLLTFSPGEIYWERFGHNAILVRDRASGEEWAYNYGLFDFNQERFFLNF